MRFWIENFSTSQILNWKFIVPEDIENITFQIIIFQRKTKFEKINFWVQFLRNKISLKNSCVKKIVLPQFAPQKATEISLFVLILKSTILKQIFSLKISVWNEVLLKKRIRLWSKLFPRKWDFELKTFNKSEFELSYFVAEDFWKQYFPNNHSLEKKCFREKIKFWIQFLRNKISMKNSHQQNCFDSIRSAENNKLLTFCAYLKRHDFEASLFIENQSSKWTFFEKKNQIMKRTFS